ncbi:hypothetical protein G7072_01490 [Nocardioides sp. HDW12B]|uniref:hypothetical protein n=1 Tax=Nocardioides sp. HDW12B TaxID=2714939 RepID=UPI001408E8EB|nr:hypothetical protein [Nocardioides sp. HDW12B]QIK65184.1 hypothetical protein G7072_01490 [Nocardioides sp. HDW12B]
MRRGLRAVVVTALVSATASFAVPVATPSLAPAASAWTEAPEDYAAYEPEDGCRTRPLPGTGELASWIDRAFTGGAARATMRTCSSSSSEHQDGRAIDWTMDADKRAQRREVARFLAKVFAEDPDGNRHALARRMGVMYVIWNDRIYASYRTFEARDYLSSSCRSVERCSKTLRHRDHVHLSLSQRGGRGLTSWYVEGS